MFLEIFPMVVQGKNPFPRDRYILEALTIDILE